MQKFLLDILNRWDPEGLVSVGDNYDIEADEIYSRLRSCHSVEDVSKLVADVFTEYFVMKYSLSQCAETAQIIWDEY